MSEEEAAVAEKVLMGSENSAEVREESGRDELREREGGWMMV